MSNGKDDQAAAGQGQDVIKARPTLIIGLGGTGGDVLLRIRKRFFEKYTSLDEFPIVSYLWVDTDKTEKQVVAREFTEFVSFRDPERIMTLINKTADITDKLDTPDNRHIREWWYPGLNSVPSLVEGAGQVRAYSRLGFVHYFAKSPNGMRESLQRQMDIISGASPRDRMLKSSVIKRAGGADLDDSGRINVYVVCSLAGGTGSGMFLDVAFLVNALHPRAEVCGYLLLPRFFGNQQKMDANGYAALKELNYFCHHDFDMKWDQYGYPKEKIPSPPFRYCYLLDNRNMAGHVVGGTAESREAIFEMMADSIFKDFTHGAFADKKRSCRVNIGPHMDSYKDVGVAIQGLEFRQAFPLRFSSMGMASIIMPHDRIITACSYRMAADIVDYWAGLGNQDTELATLHQKVREQILPLKSVGLSQDVVKGQQRNDLVDFLGREAVGGGQLANKLEPWARECADRIMRGIPAQNRKTYRSFMEEEIEQEKNLFADEAKNQAKWGDYSRTIYDNGEKLKQYAAEGLKAESARLINEEQYSIGYVATMLEQTAHVLKDQAYPYRQRFRKDLQDVEAKIPKAQKAYLDALDSLAQHERRSNWDGRNSIILAYDLECWRRAIAGTPRDPGYFRLLLTRCVLRAAVDVCDYLIEFLEGKQQPDGTFRGGYVDHLKSLKEGLLGFRGQLQRRQGYFRDNRAADLSLLLYDPLKFEEIYFRYIGGTPEDRKRAVREKSVAVLKALGGDVTCLPTMAGDQSEVMERKILEEVRPVFDAVRIDFHVVSQFERTYASKEDRIRHLKLMHAKAQPLIYGKDTNPAGFDFKPETRESAVGIPVTPTGLSVTVANDITRARVELMDMLQHQLGMNPKYFQDIPDTSEIIFYNEVGAFPVNYIEEVKNYRDKYEILRSTEKLHITSDDRKFTDLMVMDQETLRAFVEATECLVLGRIFGVITPQLSGREIHYHWLETKGINEFRRNLGDHDGTLQELAKNNLVRKNLLDQSHQILERVKVSAENLTRYYAVIGVDYSNSVTDQHGNAVHEEQLPFEAMVKAKVLSAKQQDAERASRAWSTPDEFRALGKERAKNLGDFTTQLPDRGFLLKLEEARSA